MKFSLGSRGFVLVSAVLCFLCVLLVTAKKSKYSSDMNIPSSDELYDPKEYGKKDNPFRMQKVNMLWQKAKKRLPETKLKILFADLKTQDKDEILLKKLKGEGQDKEGKKEAAIRKQLTSIINKYGLSDPWIEPEDNQTTKGISNEPEHEYLNKQVFKDKKLNKLWLKAEQAGFGDLEIKTLKEEFQHHQEKIDQYYSLMDRVNQPLKDHKDDMLNSIDTFLDDSEQKQKSSITNSHQLLKEKHKEIKSNYDKLLEKISDDKREFEEYAVQKLWDLAQSADFTPSELNSVKEELHHYENRIRKLRYFQSELDLHESGHGMNKHHAVKPDDNKHLHKKVKDFEYKVTKIHNELEGRILQRHSEL